MLLIPFLNSLIHHINQKQHILCIISLVSLSCLLGTYLHIPTYCDQLSLFVSLYMIAAYIRLYGIQKWTKRGLLLALLSVFIGTIVCIYVASAIYAISNSEYLYFTLYNFAASKNSLPTLLISILLFALVLKFDCGTSRVINFLASCTLGVYLFHEHPLMRDFIWQKVFHTAEAPFGEHPFLHCIGAILGIYIAGTIVDIIWQQTVGRLYAPTEKYVIMPIYTRVKKCGNRAIQYIMDK